MNDYDLPIINSDKELLKSEGYLQ